MFVSNVSESSSPASHAICERPCDSHTTTSMAKQRPMLLMIARPPARAHDWALRSLRDRLIAYKYGACDGSCLRGRSARQIKPAQHSIANPSGQWCCSQNKRVGPGSTCRAHLHRRGADHPRWPGANTSAGRKGRKPAVFGCCREARDPVAIQSVLDIGCLL